MSALDYFNYGMGAQGLATQENYQPNQYNTNGQSLSPTTPANGAPITTDVDNDQRTALDFKRQALEAQKDTASLNDDPNAVIGRNGYRYMNAVTGDSRIDVARTSAQSFADGYLSHMGDQAEATAAGAMYSEYAVNGHERAIKRTKLIPYLENLTNPDGSPKYNPMDIDKWAATENPKDLITNAGTWTSDGNGWMHNTLTGDSKRIQGYGDLTPYQQEKQDLELRTKRADATKAENEANGIDPKSIVNGGDIGLDADEATVDSQHMTITDPDGTVWHVATKKGGTPVVDPKTGMATVYDDKGNTSSRVYNPTYVQQSGQVSTEGLNSIKDLRQSGLLHNTGNGGWDTTKRAYNDVTGNNYTKDITSHFDTINDQMHTYAVNKLIQEGVRPTEELVRAEMNRYGHLDIDNSEKRNLDILDKMEGALNSGYHMAANNQNHTSMKDTNYASPGRVAPTGSRAATAASSGHLTDDQLLNKYLK